VALICPICGDRYPDESTFCSKDGGELISIRSARSDSLIGNTIADRYHVTEQIGVGGMGVVYKARQKLLDRWVAVKVLPQELASDKKAETRFFNEAKAISQVRHPNIVTLFDFGRAKDGNLYIVMEYVEGEALAARVRQGPLPPPDAVHIALQVMSALDEAHRAGIVHRDIKSENVMLERLEDGRERVRVLDFGIAKSEGSTRLTKTGMVFGTPEYFSPEQARGQEIDARTDIYSLGVLFFEMLCGERPFTGATPAAVVYQHLHEAPRSLVEAFPSLGIPQTLDDYVRFLLQKHPESRPQSAQQAHDILDGIRHRLGYTSSGAVPSVASGSMSRFPDMHATPSGARSGGEYRARDSSPVEISNDPPTRRRPSAPSAVADDDFDPLDVPPPSGGRRRYEPEPEEERAVSHANVSLKAQRTIPPDAEPLTAPPISKSKTGASPTNRSRVWLLGAVALVAGIAFWTSSQLDDLNAIGGEPIATRRGLPPQPAPEPSTRAVAAAGPGALAPGSATRLSDLEPAILEQVATYIRPEPIPAWLQRGELSAPPSPAAASDGLVVVPDGEGARAAAGIRQAVAQESQKLKAVPPGAPDAAEIRYRIASLEWAAADAMFAVDRARFEKQTERYLNGLVEEPPVPPEPVYGNAVMELRRLVDEHPTYAHADRALFFLGRGLFAGDQAQEGATALERLIEAHPESPLARVARPMVADHHFDAQRPASARPHYEAMIAEASPDAPGEARKLYSRFMLGYTLYNAGEPGAATQAFQEVLEAIRGGAPGAEYYKAQALAGLTASFAKEKDGLRAARSYFRGLGGKALEQKQLELLARIWTEQGRSEAAATLLGELAEATTSEARARRLHLLRAEALAAAKQTDAALTLVRDSLGACLAVASSPYLQLRCLHTLAALHEAKNAPADARKARESLLAAFESHGLGPGALEGRYAASARFRLAGEAFSEWVDREARTLARATPPQVDAIKARAERLDADLAAVARLNDPDWSIAAAYRRGEVYRTAAEALRKAGDKGATALEEIALRRYESARAQAHKHGIRGEWAIKVQSRLESMRPERYPPRP
jgi:serine/threonine-protein kinase